ncbi:hypothetical protein BDA96_05G022000 [Sorghum bicolor]|uniref:Uncharacterized protein n=1 Tax=Sorghum bicolor TaxID=4558 RepID=A0A921UEF1_SORBI|nr:hypothetical protein BDA96_05G022000 [Sorghum bicolor]
MALDADNILMHIKRTLHSSVRLAYQSASDYPVVLGIGMLLLFLHKLCPSLFAFFLSSSPVFLLTALLLGALLSYGEPSAPVIGEDQKKSSVESRISISECSVVEEVQNVNVTHMSRSFESPYVCVEGTTTSDSIFHDTHRDEDSIVTSVSADTIRCTEASELAKNEVVIVEREEHVKEVCNNVELQQFFQSSAAEGVSVKEAENVADKVNVGTRFECPVMYSDDKTSEGVLLIGAQCGQGNLTSMSTDSVLHAESSGFDRNGVIAERVEEEHVKEICEQVAPPRQSESTATGRCHYEYEVNHQYQFGELMSSCWQPVTRQDPCSDSESDLTESSSDASITDIIPMLDELNTPVDLGTSHPSSTFGDNLNAGSSDENEDDSEEEEEEEDGNLSSDEDGEEKRDDESSWKGFVDPNSLDTEKNGDLESLMARRKAKNVLKFELDRRLMDLQAADAVQKMEEASRFRVQVPSISTPRPDPSNDPEDTVELPQVPDSAPSVLLPWRKPFDVPFDQIVDRDSRLQETWTPRSGFSSAQGRKRDSLYARPSTYLRHHNGIIKPEKSEFSEKDSVDNHSESDSEQPLDNNGKLFGSLEPHIGDEIKIVSAAISDVCVLEANHGIIEGGTDSINGTDSFYVQKLMSNTSDVNDSISAGNEQSVLCYLSEEHKTTEEHIMIEVEEEDSMSEVNSLFKCRMEEVLVQSISESGIGQPLTVKLEHELSDTLLHAEPAISLIEARSVEDLNSQFAQLNGEALLAPAASVSIRDDQYQPVHDRPSEALPMENGDTDTQDGHSSDRSLDGSPVAVKVIVEGEGEPKEVLTEDGELHVLEASSVEEMSSLFRQLEGAAAAGPAVMPACSSESEHMFVGQHTGETETESAVLVPNAKPAAWDDTNPTYVQLSIGGGDKMKIPGDGEVILDDSTEVNSGPYAKDDGRYGSDDTRVFEAKESLGSA